MGLLRFLVHPSSSLLPDALERAHLVGFDQIPWLGRTRATPDGFLLERSERDSGSLRIPWHVPGHGGLLLSSGTLVEREAPYQLEIELARGKLNQLRNQLAEWEGLGLLVPLSLSTDLRRAVGQLAAAVTQPDADRAVPLARTALANACDVAARLATVFSEQALATRHRQAPRLETLLVGTLGTSSFETDGTQAFLSAFNAASVALDWAQIESQEGSYDWTTVDRHIEFCQTRGLRVLSGPLVQLDAGGLPDWLYLWTGDLSNLAGLAARFVETAVSRYRGRVQLWQCLARANAGNALGLSEEETLQLAVHLIETLRQADPQTPLTLAIDQPWAEYMSQREFDLSPWHFADALVRSGLGLAALELELHVGYPGGTYPRDVLELSRLLDQWNLLGLPLFVRLSFPDDEAIDPLARRASEPVMRPAPDAWTRERQADWVRQWVTMLLAKPQVRGIVWHQWHDGQPHDFAHAGLLDTAGRPKPAHAALVQLRRTHLQ